MRSRGFTLVELLVSLTIFAVLGLASWQVLNQMIRTKTTLTQHSVELQQLQRAVWQITQDLRSIVDRPVRDNYGTREPAVTSVIPGFAVVFTRNGRANPLHARRSELQRVAYGIEESETGKRLVRYTWAQLDRAPAAQPVKQILLEPVNRLDIQFIDNRGQTAFYWPPAESRDGEYTAPVPSGIRLRLSLPRWGDIERVIQLRDVRPS